MRGWALGLVLVAVASAAGAQDGLRTARAPAVREAPAAPSEAVARIQRAAAAQKFALVFFWAEQNPQTDQAWAVLQAVARRMPEWLDVVVVQLCVYEQATPGGVAVPAGARDFKADERFGSATEVVLVNARDVKETGFRDELKVDTRAPKPFTVLLVPPGTVVGQFDARATKDQMWAQLAATLSRAGGSGTCGPNGCRPRQ